MCSEVEINSVQDFISQVKDGRLKPFFVGEEGRE